jgi:hypothetical protein
VPEDVSSASKASRTDIATPSSTARAISARPIDASRPRNVPRAEASQSGARSPDRCGRNSAGRLDAATSAMRPSGVASNIRQSQASDAPPDWVGAAWSVRPICGGKTSAPSAGLIALEMTPGISLVPERYIASPSAFTPTPNIEAQASISPVATGTGRSAPGSVVCPRPRPDRASPAGARAPVDPVEEVADEGPILPHRADLADGVGDMRAGQLPDHPVLRQEDLRRRGPKVRFRLRHPGHARGHVAGVDTHGRAPPRLALRGRDPGIEAAAATPARVSAQVIAGCRTVPSGGAEDMGVHLARDADGGDGGGRPAASISAKAASRQAIQSAGSCSTNPAFRAVG